MANPDDIVSKSEFARHCKVVPGLVTQWISKGLISGPALVGEGRSAKIRLTVALEQVKLRRDVGQALGNGISTRLSPLRASHPPQDADAEDSEDQWPTDGKNDDVDRKLKLNKLEAAERTNRLAAIEEAASQGIYTETAAARMEMGKIAGQMIRIFEGALPEIATAIAAEFKIDARDVSHQLNEQFRKVREQVAEAAKKAASALRATTDDTPPATG